MNENINDETVIDLGRLFQLLKKGLVGIILWGIFGAIIASLVSFVFMTPKYSATTDILVNQKVDNVTAQYNVQQADLQVINTYKDVLTKPVILAPVLKLVRQTDNYQGSIGSLESAVSVSNTTNSQVVSVTVTDKNAYTASDIANAIAQVFSKKIKKMMKINNVTIVTEATPDTTPVSPNKKLNLLIGIVVGVLIGVAIIVLRDLMDTTVRDDKFLRDELGLSNLGTISHMGSKKYRKFVSVKVAQDAVGKIERRV